MIKLLGKAATVCMTGSFMMSGALAKAEVLGENLGRRHDLLPFLTASLPSIWWGGGTATIAGQSKNLEISTQLSYVWAPGNVLTNEVKVSTTLKLEGYADKNVDYTMSFDDEHNFSIIVGNQILGAGNCFAEHDYDVTCDFEIPSLQHKEVFHFYQTVFPQDSTFSISAQGTTNLWGPPALLDYKL